MSSKPIGGFDLVLGKLYNEGWFNFKSPDHNGGWCDNCKCYNTLHHLHKFVFAFGNIIEKFTQVITCPSCLHEQQVDSHLKQKKQRATKVNLARIFSKLPKQVQQQLLMQTKI